MRIRKLQCQDINAEWHIDSYACEVEPHQVIFQYNSKTWGRIGAFYHHRIQKVNASLEDLEAVICPTFDVRWLPVECVTECQINALNEACGISVQGSDDDYCGQHLATTKRAAEAVVGRSLGGTDTTIDRLTIFQSAPIADFSSLLATKPLPPLPLNQPAAA